MTSRALDLFVGYLEKLPYWQRIQPYLILAFGWIATELLAYEYIQAEHGFKPSLWLFVRSYFFIRILIVFAALAVLLALFQIRPGANQTEVGRLRSYVRKHQTVLTMRAVFLLLIVAGAALAFAYFGPNRVSTIHVKLLSEPASFRPAALAYVIYELNQNQKHWYFELDFEPFNPSALKSTELAAMEQEDRPQLYLAELIAAGKPLIAITEESLGKAFFCEHRKNVSVISTIDQGAYAPLSTYEYLAYCLVVQSIVVHLDVHGGGLPAEAFKPSSSSHGGVFQFNPSREILKASILAAQLSPEEESLLFNRFGAQYMRACGELLTLDWLRSERVLANLATHFGITNAATATSRLSSPKKGDGN
jgi:hypothetical protein